MSPLLLSPRHLPARSVCGLLSMVVVAMAAQPKRNFDLPRGDAATMLARFAEQSGRPVLFAMDKVRGARTNTVAGEFSPTEALERLLAGTELIAVLDPTTGDIVVSRRVPPEGKGPGAPTPPTDSSKAAQPERQEPPPVKKRTFLSLLAGWLVATMPEVLPAQSVPATANPAGNVVQMSPFTVDSSKDSGYAASETLSGTRLRTPIRDVGASLSILTPEFLADLAVDAAHLALIYTPSVDTYMGENESQLNGASLRFGNGQQVSLRGFVAGPSSSHDFFPALEPNDSYNIERITLSRGPNAMLFGLGGSAGAAVSSIKRAQYSPHRPSLALKIDRWGSHRAEFDLNHELIDNRLALRVNALYSQKKEFRRYEGFKQHRATVGVRWTPFKNTDVIINHEEYRTGLNQFPLVAPFDVGTLRWIQNGRPTVNFLSEGRAWTVAGRTFRDANGNPVPRADGNGFITSAAQFNTGSALQQTTAHSLRYVTGINLPNPVVNYRWDGTFQNSLFGGVSAGTNHNLLDADPWKLYGIPDDANLFTGTWDDPARQNRGRWTTLLIEQKLAPNLYLELGGNFARDFNFTNTDSLHIIRFDVNRYLPDGQSNPGYLQPYAEVNGGGQYRKGLTTQDSLRATLSYEYDLRKLHKWLNRQSVSLLLQSDKNEAELDNSRVSNRATAGLPGFAASITDNTHQLHQRVYYVNGVVPDPLVGQTETVDRLAQINGYGTALGATAAERVPLNFALRPFLQAVKSRSITESLSFAWIGRFFNDRLVTTTGVRRDEWKLYGIPARRTLSDPAVANPTNNPLYYFFDPASQIPFNADPTKTSAATNRTFGGVVRAASWLDLTFSRSYNFTPSPNTTNTNYLDEIIPERAGATTDFGLRFYALDNRLSVSLTKFKTVAGNESRNAASYSNGVRSILRRLRENYKDTGHPYFADMEEEGVYRVERTTTTLASSWDYVADGYEAALTFNPNQSWRIYLSGSANKNVLGAHLLDVGTYLNTPTKFQGLETWARFASELRRVAAGQSSTYFNLNPALAEHRAQAATDATFIETQAAADRQRYEDEQALTGRTTNRNGKYSFNGLVTHTFRGESWLRGVSVGGNFRWRSASIVGYERTRNAAGRPLAVIDVSKPITGEDYLDAGLMLSRDFRFGATTLKLQLNVENLFDWRDKRLVAVDVDSEGYYGTLDANVPIRYETRRPRNFILSAKYTF